MQLGLHEANSVQDPGGECDLVGYGCSSMRCMRQGAPGRTVPRDLKLRL